MSRAAIALVLACGCAETRFDNPLDPQRPEGTGLQAPRTEQVSFADVEISWTALDHAAVTGYRIHRYGTEADWTVLADVAATETSYRDRGLGAGTRYHYKITALGAAGAESADGPEATFLLADTAPLVLDEAQIGIGRAVVTWFEPTQPWVKKVRLTRIPPVGDEVVLSPVDATEKHILDDVDEVEEGQTYRWRAALLDDEGNEGPDATRSETAPLEVHTEPSEQVVAERRAATPDRATVNWIAVPGAASYEIEGATLPYTNDSFAMLTTAPAPPVLVTSLDAQEDYVFRVRAVGANGKRTFPSGETGWEQADAPRWQEVFPDHRGDTPPAGGKARGVFQDFQNSETWVVYEWTGTGELWRMSVEPLGIWKKAGAPFPLGDAAGGWRFNDQFNVVDYYFPFGWNGGRVMTETTRVRLKDPVESALVTVNDPPDFPRTGHATLFEPTSNALYVLGGVNAKDNGSGALIPGDEFAHGGLKLAFGGASLVWEEYGEDQPVLYRRGLGAVTFLGEDPGGPASLGGGTIYMWGGVDESGQGDAQLWAHNPSTASIWQARDTEDPPPPRYDLGAGMTNHPWGRSIFVAGGYLTDDDSPTNEVWELDLPTLAWTKWDFDQALPAPGPGPVAATVINTSPHGYGLAVFNEEGAWTLRPNGTGRAPAWRHVDQPPQARAQAAWAFDWIENRFILVGGRDQGGGALDEVWQLAVGLPSEFSRVPTAAVPGHGAPAPRFGAAAAFDGQFGHAYLFGGSSAAGVSADATVHRLDLTSHPAKWSQVSVAGGGPAGRVDHHVAVVGDGQEKRLFVVSGDGNFVGEVWMLTLGDDVPAWAQMAGAQRPADLSGLQSCWDGDARVVYLTGNEQDGTHAIWRVDLDEGAIAWEKLTLPENGPSNEPAVGLACAWNEPALYMLFGADEQFALWRLGLAAPMAWQEMGWAGAPPAARTGAPFLYNPNQTALLLIHGAGQAGLFSDVWRFSLL